MEKWQLIGIVGSIAAVVLLFVMAGVGKTVWSQKRGAQNEKETEMVEMAALEDVDCTGDECCREETCFGCPPEGPDVALDQDPNRFLGDPHSTD